MAVVAFQVDGFDSLVNHGWCVLTVGVMTAISQPEELAVAQTISRPEWPHEPGSGYFRLSPGPINGYRLDPTG